MSVIRFVYLNPDLTGWKHLTSDFGWVSLGLKLKEPVKMSKSQIPAVEVAILDVSQLTPWRSEGGLSYRWMPSICPLVLFPIEVGSMSWYPSLANIVQQHWFLIF